MKKVGKLKPGDGMPESVAGLAVLVVGWMVGVGVAPMLAVGSSGVPVAVGVDVGGTMVADGDELKDKVSSSLA